MDERAVRRVEWKDAAACRDMGFDEFFPEAGAVSDEVMRLCYGCPVNVECVSYAARLNLTSGVFGGTRPRDRQTIRRGWRESKGYPSTGALDQVAAEVMAEVFAQRLRKE